MWDINAVWLFGRVSELSLRSRFRAAMLLLLLLLILLLVAGWWRWWWWLCLQGLHPRLAAAAILDHGPHARLVHGLVHGLEVR